MTSLNDIVAVVLAGGFGTRIRHLLPGLPKPMAPVAGRPFLEWIVRYLRKQGIREVILSTGYRHEVIEEHFRSGPVEGVNVCCVAEKKPLGTAGGFLHAVQASRKESKAWLVLNGDSLVFVDLTVLAEGLKNSGVAGVIAGVWLPDAGRFGLLSINAAGDVVGFSEKQPGAGLVNAGVYLLRDKAISDFPAAWPLSFERDVFPRWLGRGKRLKALRVDASFLDIGTEESLPAANNFVRQHLEWF